MKKMFTIVGVSVILSQSIYGEILSNIPDNFKSKSLKERNSGNYSVNKIDLPKQSNLKLDKPIPMPEPKLDMPEHRLEPKLNKPMPMPEPKLDMPEHRLEPKLDKPMPMPEPKLDMPEHRLEPKLDKPMPMPEPKLDMPEPTPEPKLDNKPTNGTENINGLSLPIGTKVTYVKGSINDDIYNVSNIQTTTNNIIESDIIEGVTIDSNILSEDTVIDDSNIINEDSKVDSLFEQLSRKIDDKYRYGDLHKYEREINYLESIKYNEDKLIEFQNRFEGNY
jgi:hypothetical protein